MDVVYAMENVEKGRSDRPKEPVTIVKSGEVSSGLDFMRRADSCSFPSSSRLMMKATRYLFVLSSNHLSTQNQRDYSVVRPTPHFLYPPKKRKAQSEACIISFLLNTYHSLLQPDSTGDNDLPATTIDLPSETEDELLSQEELDMDYKTISNPFKYAAFFGAFVILPVGLYVYFYRGGKENVKRWRSRFGYEKVAEKV